MGNLERRIPLFESGKKEMIGKIITGKDGKKYKKIAEGKWREVSEHGMTKKEHDAAAKIADKNIRVDGFHPSDTKSKGHEQWKSRNEHWEQSDKLSDKERSDEEVGI